MASNHRSTETTAGSAADNADGQSLSVTVVNHCARDLLRQCLLALEAHPYTLGPMEVVVLDNASDDGSVEMLRTEFPNVVVLAQQERCGFGTNQNRAIAASHGELLFMLNPDCLVHTGTIDRLVAALGRDRRVAAVGGPVVNADGSLRQGRLNAFRTPLSPFEKALGLGRLRSGRPIEAGITTDGWPSGGACLVKRNVFEAVGGFDEGFFMYSEDADLFAQLAARGYAIAWVDDAAVTHPFPSESASMSTRREAEKVKSELRYIRKHHGANGERVYRVGIVVDAASRVALLSIPGLTRVVQRHGKTLDETRRRHRARLGHALRPSGKPGLAELADEWNVRHASSGGTRPSGE